MTETWRWAMLAVIGSVWLSGGAWAQPAGGAEVALARPPVEVIARGQPAARPLAKGARLSEGDRVRTGRGGAAEIRLGDGSLVRLGELSDLEIDKLDMDAAGTPSTSRFNLATGQARAWVARQVIAKVATGQGRFAVQTPTAVAAVRQTDFAVLQNVAPGGAGSASGVSRVYTFAGGVETALITGRTPVLCTRNRWTQVAPQQDPTPCRVIPIRERHAILRDLAFEAFHVDPDNPDRLATGAIGSKLDKTTGGQASGSGVPGQSGRPDAVGNEGTAVITITVE